MTTPRVQCTRGVMDLDERPGYGFFVPPFVELFVDAAFAAESFLTESAFIESAFAIESAFGVAAGAGAGVAAGVGFVAVESVVLFSLVHATAISDPQTSERRVRRLRDMAVPCVR